MSGAAEMRAAAAKVARAHRVSMSGVAYHTQAGEDIAKLIDALPATEPVATGTGAVVWRLSHAHRKFREDEQFAFIGELCFGNVSKSFGAETWRWEAPVLVTEKNDLGWSTAYTKLSGDADSELAAKAACETAIRQHWRALDARELLSSWMLSRGYATGHGDSIEGLLGELEGQIAERNLRADALNDLAYAHGAHAALAAMHGGMPEAEFLAQIERRSKEPLAELTRLRELNAALTADIARKDKALHEIAREQSAENAIVAADKFQTIARAALQPLAPGSKPLSEGGAK